MAAKIPPLDSMDPISQTWLGAQIALVYTLRLLLLLLIIIAGLVGSVAWMFFHRC